MPIFTTFQSIEWDPGRDQKQCAFCPTKLKGANRTREDYWPRWLQKKFPHRTGEKSSHFMRSSFIGDQEKLHGSFGIRKKVKYLCNKCNNEFSSRIQQEAVNSITNSLSRNFKNLDGDDFIALSRWATLFTMTWEFSDYKTKSISQKTRESFRKYDKIPDNVRVWLGRYRGTGFQLGQQHLNYGTITNHSGNRTMRPDDEIAIHHLEQMTTIGLGSVFLAVHVFEDLGWTIGGEDEGVKPFNLSDAFRGAAIELTDGSQTWPSQGLPELDDDDVQDFALQFMPVHLRGGVRRIGARPGVSRDFWRKLTSEPSWQ